LKLLLNNKSFIAEFINPILEINKNGKTAIFCDDNRTLHAIYLTDDRTVYLYIRYTPEKITDPIPRFNINLSKLSQALSCIKSTDSIILNVDDKKTTYKDDTVAFTVNGTENEEIPTIKFSVAGFENFNVINTFKINQSIINELKRADAFASDTTKFYLEREDDKLYIMFGDKTAKHYNSIKVLIQDNFEENMDEIIYNNPILRLLFRAKGDIAFKVCDNSALIATVTTEKAVANYITTKLKK
jgi:hypothetical protein